MTGRKSDSEVDRWVEKAGQFGNGRKSPSHTTGMNGSGAMSLRNSPVHHQRRRRPFPDKASLPIQDGLRELRAAVVDAHFLKEHTHEPRIRWQCLIPGGQRVVRA